MIRTRYWVAAAVALLVLSGAASAFMLLNGEAAAGARVILDGKVIRTVDLSNVGVPYEFDVSSDYGTNRIRVEKGRICVVSADCPDRLCVGMGWISQGTATIACLPHRLVIETDSDGGVDAVAGVKP